MLRHSRQPSPRVGLHRVLPGVSKQPSAVGPDGDGHREAELVERARRFLLAPCLHAGKVGPPPPEHVQRAVDTRRVWHVHPATRKVGDPRPGGIWPQGLAELDAPARQPGRALAGHVAGPFDPGAAVERAARCPVLKAPRVGAGRDHQVPSGHRRRTEPPGLALWKSREQPPRPDRGALVTGVAAEKTIIVSSDTAAPPPIPLRTYSASAPPVATVEQAPVVRPARVGGSGSSDHVCVCRSYAIAVAPGPTHGPGWVPFQVGRASVST